jgi:hypothetical protein
MYELTSKLNILGQCPSLQASQEIPLILWNPYLHYRIHTCPPPVSVLSQISSVHVLASKWRPILILPFHLRLGLQSSIFSFGFPHQNLVCTSPFSHTCYMPRPSHYSRFDDPNNIWCGPQTMKLQSVQFPPIPCCLIPLIPHIFVSIRYSNTLSLRSSHVQEITRSECFVRYRRGRGVRDH